MTVSELPKITKPNVYETARIRLTSPMLHIGSEVSQLSPFEYVETPDRVYLPDKDALAIALLKRGYLNDYIGAIERKESIEDVLDDAFGDNWNRAKSPSGQRIFPPHLSSRNWVEGNITDLRPMIRNGFGYLYIPGSSIKGAIRTAIAYHLLKNSKQYNAPVQVSAIEKQLRQKLDSGEFKNKFKQKFADDRLLMNDLFENFSLQYKHESQIYSPSLRTGPNTDFMRAIHVTDSQPLLEKTLTSKKGKKQKFNIPVVSEVVVSSHFSDGKAKSRASIYAELAYNVRAQFTITLDTEMLSWFRHKEGMQLPFKNLDELLNICQDFAQEQWNNEVKYWENIGNNRHNNKTLDFDLVWDKYYSKAKCPYSLRMGWGTGMLGTTVNSLFNDELRSEIRDTCSFKKAPGFEAPKSRRTVMNKQGNICYPLGWVTLKKL
ncbi:type III-A CRISPR-associated RAMP protein Csm5 [Spirulina sp. 06S082]|uniref:type III-A CRISPR-associated RAMP protein Csm5 n=1 Tax=Spirulina sp. 06S082 TaxID=3110248 RepID=UPI002B21BDB1|nr:type III-A CRISPR-associated RAMP protein Csm5 [Spirulina sp. 06S082]MEA5471206.1 type III-A CRISPR-associated RAMP protein Csm5 [Spirulina sp. 06S082]